MKKAFKIFFITIATLLLVLIATISIALWFVFTPEKLTPFVQKQAGKYLTCKSEIGKVELTFFSTFPSFGLKVDHFELINPVPGAPNDTLINLDQLVGIVDAVAWWKRDEIKISELILSKGSINIFYDSLGNSNYNIFQIDTLATAEPQPESKPIEAGLENISFENVNFSYTDLSMKLVANIRDMAAEMTGTLQSDILTSNIKVDHSIVSLEYDGEKYLNNASTHLEMLSDISYSNIMVKINEASGTLNDLPIHLNGSLTEDPATQNLVFGLNYNVEASPIDKLQLMVPPSYQSYFEGIDAKGSLAIDGKITGIYNDTTMPIFDVHLLMENGTIKYEGFPLQLHDAGGDVTISTDLTDPKTFVRIDRFEAKTPLSSFSTKGLVNHLFSDIYCDLTTDANLTLEEFNPMVPADMKLKMKGNAQGQVKSAFTMAQVEKMQLEKMKLSGSIALSDFDVAYDSIMLKTNRSKMEFAIPNINASTPNTRFAFVKITSDNLDAGMLDSYSANLQKAHIILETSNMMDSTRIPDLICTFSIDSLSGGMDTMSIAVAKPQGKASVSPRPDQPNQPMINLAFNSHGVDARMGKSKVVIKNINFDTEIVNHNEQKDIFMQWLVKGFINMQQSKISMAGFTYPIEIPSLKMDFAPEALNIHEGKLKIDKSDFQLTGNMKNILSYYRGDSILRGNFNFNSNSTDVLQLMTMTNGIGYEKENQDSARINKSSSSDTGPYMVPKGIDISLNANVGHATFGTDTATNLSGNVRVYDGILLLEDIKLTTPATRIQLTSMYRTPRKNHLFLGLDYHMFDIEIEELLRMIPDVDSLMPMLRSFRGKGEFHLAIETYLDSMYNIKKSTLRGASSIKGQDLVLMDGETFSEIAKKLMFNKKTVNRVDSLSAEFTIFRDEIDIYPFLIVMDKYKAVVGGRHNFDLSFDYHISVVDCPLPVKLGIDVKGTMDNMTYSLAKCKYAELYRPSSRKVVENKQLELRKMIRDALTERVKKD
jgi:hypothetical protein